MNWREHIVLDPAICHGSPTFRGTRVMVSAVLGYLAAGRTEQEIREDFPALGSDAVRAALAYAAELVGGESVLAAAP
jgi:uncharacterized protein (DUF433 family)